MSARDFLVEIGTEELPPKSLLTLAAAFPVAAADMCDSGRVFGSMHISVEAQNGVLGQDVHPGMHRGFSGCVR
jgi:hypothetical protein